MSSPIQATFRQLVEYARARPGLAAAALGTALVLPPTLLAGYRDYQLFLSIGPGGIPYNFGGWLLQMLGQVAATPTSQLTDDAPFRHPLPKHAAFYAGRGMVSYLPAADLSVAKNPPPLETRRGSRPSVPGFIAPQRQNSDFSPEGMRVAQDAFLHALAAANPKVLAIRPSQAEGVGTPALWNVTDEPRWPALPPHKAKQELCHAHGESSSHMVLSMPDALQVVTEGWGQRHKLSGRRSLKGTLPPTYMFVYAPRDEAELRVWKRLVVATARFAAAGGPTGGEIVVPED